MTRSGQCEHFEAPGAVAEEITRLDLLRRLSLGAAHTLNNAFTAILGETLGLLDERKGDPLVAEACRLIQGEVERCARLLRAITVRMHRRTSLMDETSLGNLMRGLEPLLRETVSRSVALACEMPPISTCVRGASEDIELLALVCAHRLVRGAASGVLHVSVETHDPNGIALRIEFRDGGGGGDTEDGDTNPDWAALVEASVRALSERHGIAVREDGNATSRCVRLHLTRAPQD
jgi:signal transduction histidine kinase